MIGATMIEKRACWSDYGLGNDGLLSTVYALHPGFAEAQIINTGAGLGPAFPDNIPVLRRTAGGFHLNGLYRHGFLMAVVLALELVQQLRKEMAGVLQLKSRRECPQMGQNVPPSVKISSHSPWVQLDSICSTAGMKFVERAGSPVREQKFLCSA